MVAQGSDAGRVCWVVAQVPGITLATDIICGFPTETEEDFQGSLDLMAKYKYVPASACLCRGDKGKVSLFQT